MFKFQKDPIIRSSFMALNCIFELIFDLVTLTVCHLKRYMDIDPMYKFDQDPIISS